jgi:hypothetical protein
MTYWLSGLIRPKKNINSADINEVSNEKLRHLATENSFFEAIYGQDVKFSPGSGEPCRIDFSMPTLYWAVQHDSATFKLGTIEGIEMTNGTVTIPHFALNYDGQTRIGLGEIFVEHIIDFFKNAGADYIEFRETHTSKIGHYEILFDKMRIPSTDYRKWKVELSSESS